MIGTTLFIAGAEAAVSQQPDGLRAWQLDDVGELVECHRQAQMFLDCPSEKRVVHNLPDLKQLKLELQLWSAKQRTLYYLLAGMDRELRETTRSRRLLAAEEQLGDSACAAFVRARLLGCALPAVADLAGAQILAQALPRCRKLYQELDAGKLYIATVKHALQEVIADNADQHFAVDEVYLSMLDHGVVAAAVGALAHNDRNGLEDLLWQFAPNKALMAACPQLSKILMQLVKRMQPHLVQTAQLATVPNILGLDVEDGKVMRDILLQAKADVLIRQAAIALDIRIQEQRLLKHRERLLKNRIISDALACLLIDKGSFAEAEQLLSAANAQVRDWFDYHVLAMLKLKLGQDDLAESMLRTGARTAPTLEDRTVFAHALSTYLLRQKRWEEAEQALHNPDSHIITSAFTHLLQAHSLAASNKLPAALNWLNLAKPINVQTEELKDAIARRYGLAGNVAEATAQWDDFIAEHEFNLALRMRQTSTLLMA